MASPMVWLMSKHSTRFTGSANPSITRSASLRACCAVRLLISVARVNCALRLASSR
ncbi:hypothetical protein D3C73_1672870 [compost metagenome]